MKELIFTLAFFFTNGNIIDTNLKLHKYDKQNFKKIYFSKNKNTINVLPFNSTMSLYNTGLL